LYGCIVWRQWQPVNGFATFAQTTGRSLALPQGVGTFRRER
jgi:hypothetical protein